MKNRVGDKKKQLLFLSLAEDDYGDFHKTCFDKP